MNYGT